MTIEDTPVNFEYQNDMTKVAKIEKEMYAARNKIAMMKTSSAKTVKDLEKFLAHNRKVQMQWASSGYDQKCAQINQLKKKWNKYKKRYDPCLLSMGTRNRLKEVIQWGIDELNYWDMG